MSFNKDLHLLLVDLVFMSLVQSNKELSLKELLIKAIKTLVWLLLFPKPRPQSSSHPTPFHNVRHLADCVALFSRSQHPLLPNLKFFYTPSRPGAR